MFHSHTFADLLAPFHSLFPKPTWEKALVLVEGTVLARGRRTVTAALRSMGQEHLSSFTCFHQVLNRARWSPLKLSRLLLLLLVSTFVHEGGTVEIALDETLERRWGPHILKCAYYHDPVRSSQKYRKISRGLKWLCVMLIITPPWTSRTWALPFLCVLLWGLPMIGTESWNRYVAQMYCVPLTENLEKLFGRGDGLSQETMVSLSNRLWESEMIFAMNIDVLEMQ